MANDYQHGGYCNKRFCHHRTYGGSKQYGGKVAVPIERVYNYPAAPRLTKTEPIIDNQSEETMRKIEEAMNRSLVQGRDFKRDNTEVVWVRHENGDLHSASIYLHGHKVGWYYYSGSEKSWMLLLDDCQWLTVTTKSRLNALLRGMADERTYIYQEDFQWFLVQSDGVPRNWNSNHRFTAMPPAGYTNERRIA